jgi:4-hydroxymandelate oxidase
LIRVEDFEEEARQRLPQMVFDYFAGGAGDEWTLEENRRAFDRWLLRPRILNDVSQVDLRTEVLGHEVTFPVLLAPTALQRMAHRDGELASARAAAAAGTLMILSTISTFSLEEVAATEVPRWFQLYVHRDRGLTEELVARAAAAGYGAIVLTVDAPFLGQRYRDERNRFSLPPGIGLANLAAVSVPRTQGSDLFAYFTSELDPTLSWRDVEWLRSLSTLPLVLKGIMTAEDAVQGVNAGADALIVSNHGGRQLDGVAATIDVLPEVAGAVGGKAEVLMDGGIRRGVDVLKSLALGARAVLIGRPYLWGLAVDGEAGVGRILELLRQELTLAMALAGCAAVKAVDRSAVMPAPA